MYNWFPVCLQYMFLKTIFQKEPKRVSFCIQMYHSAVCTHTWGQTRVLMKADTQCNTWTVHVQHAPSIHTLCTHMHNVLTKMCYRSLQ